MSKQYPGGIISKTPVTPSGPYATSTASGIWTLDQQAYWQKLGQWPTAGNFPIDPQFNYVTMLLHGDGTNGAQNNTFLDSSASPLTITRNGNTTQGSFSPYGSNWSNYFDGSGTWLTVPDSSAWAFGSGDFTVEFWYYPVSNTTTDIEFIGQWTSGSTDESWSIGHHWTFGLIFFWTTDGSTDQYIGGTSTSLLTLNAWNHVAVSKSGTTVSLYLNGARTNTGTLTGSISDSSRVLDIGGRSQSGANQIQGYLSNVRVVKGTAVYNPSSSTLTVPTSPLTAISGTGLLTCQSNRFVDNSASPLTITINGAPNVQRFNPFGTSTAYSTSVIGGSGYFDGTGDYLSTASDANLAIGSSDFCIEYWVYSNNSNQITPFGQWVGSDQNWILQYRTGANQFRFYYNSSNELSGNYTIVPNAWTHVVVCRSGSTMSLYANGTRLATKTDSTSINNTTGLSVGRNADNLQYVTGFITDARIVVGSSVYTPSSSTLTVPTAPLTAITNTKFLANMTNGAIFDNAMMNDLETVGNAQISTSVKKYGTGSLAFDGTGDYLKVNKSIPQNIFGGNFTIEFWFNVDGTSGYKRMFNNAPGTAPSGYFYIYYNGTDIRMYNVDVGILITVGTFTANTWTFLAISRSGSTTRVFVNGTQTYSYSGSTFFLSDDLYIGGGPDGEYTNGYIDDFRITAGYARYTANFTPPTAALFDYGPT